jgi:hypothetical protein
MTSCFALFRTLRDHADDMAVFYYPGSCFRADPRYEVDRSLIVAGKIAPNDRLVMSDAVTQVAQAIRFLVDKVSGDPGRGSRKRQSKMWRPDACLMSCGEQGDPKAISQRGDYITGRNAILADAADKRRQGCNEDTPKLIRQALLESWAERPFAAVNLCKRFGDGIAEKDLVGLKWKIEGFGYPGVPKIQGDGTAIVEVRKPLVGRKARWGNCRYQRAEPFIRGRITGLTWHGRASNY